MGLNKAELKDLVLSTYEAEKKKPPKRLLAKAFNLSRSSLYYREKRPVEDLNLKNEILKWHKMDDTLGSKKLGTLIGKSRGCIARIMLKYGVYPRRKRPAYKYPGKASVPYLSPNFV